MVLVLPLVVDLSPLGRTAVTLANIAIWAVFAVDYLARLYLSRDRGRFVRTHVLDLVIVLLPMLRPLRALRILRVLRVSSVAALAHKRATRSLHARVTAYVFSAALVSMLVMGRAVALGLMIVGIALLGVVTAAIAAWFVDRLQEVEESVEKSTEATLDEVLVELREIRALLDVDHEARN